MSKCGISEFDRTRQRNQFTRHERDHLLCIMNEFSEKLEDKNLSILARKEIWTTIDKKFRDGGFIDRTTAQLKKYWQNYKYHNGRNKWRKENTSMDIEFLSKSSKVHDDSSICHIEASGQSQSVEKIAKLCQDKSELPMDLIKQPAVIISETDVSGTSVTVSVIHSKNGKRKNSFDCKSDVINVEIGEGINNGGNLNPSKKLKRKCLLLQPRKSNKHEKIDENYSAKISQSPKQFNDNIINIKQDEHIMKNDGNFSSLINSNNYHEQFNRPMDIENYPNYQGNNFQYTNFHVIRQLQLLRHLEAEEYRLKVKLAEMTLKETHLKILHLREECESTQIKYTI